MRNSEKLEAIRAFAAHCLKQYDLTDRGWTFSWDRARRRFGCCNFSERRISLSKHLALLNPQNESYETILHEIAHALAGPGAGHGPKWKEVCRQIGAKPVRCYDAQHIVQPKSPYVRFCPNCMRSHPMYRRSNRKAACASCCRAFNRGRYADRFKLIVVSREQFESIDRKSVA